MPAFAAQASAIEARGIGLPDSWKSAEFNRDWGLAAINAHHAYARGLTGRGVSVGNFDTGTALEHPEFSGRGHVALTLAGDGCAWSPDVVEVRGSEGCFASVGNELTEIVEVAGSDQARASISQEYVGHGTHTAGTIAAARDGKAMHGVSFGARLILGRFFPNVKVRRREDYVSSTTALASSMEGNAPEVIASFYDQSRRHDVRVVNLEIWHPLPPGPASENTLARIEKRYIQERQMFDAFADAAVGHNMLNVVALGNDDGRMANALPGLPAFRSDAQPHWLSVANVARSATGDYQIAPSSSICAYTRMWCISAPGTDIYSTYLTGDSGGRLLGDPIGDGDLLWLRGKKKPQMTYGTATGTSMAAPHAAGSVALLVQRFPYMTVTQVRDVLLTTTKDLGKPGVDEVYGWGLIDLRKAVEGPGQLLADTHLQMHQRAGGAKVWRGSAWDDWRNDIGGTGTLIKSGPGILRLSGRNRFGGLRVREGAIELAGDNAYPTQVDGGLLQVDGTLASASLPVAPAGRLGGIGRIVGDVRMAGMLSPGISIGTLTVQGNYVQLPGSTYLAEVDVAGHSDRLQVSGQALLEGGRMLVSPSPGRYLLGQSYDVLHADGGVVGRFTSLQQPELLPFLAFGLHYEATRVGLRVDRGELLEKYARTLNQRAAAYAADRLPPSQGLPRVLTQMSPGPAMAALDALSGASHASQHSLLLENGRRLRETTFERLRSGRGQFAADPKGSVVEGAWAQAQMSSISLPGDGNAAAAGYHSNGGLIGYDHRFESGVRLGILGGGSRSDGQFGRFDRSRVRSKQIGLYAGQQWGLVELAGTFSWADHGIGMDRQITFDGFSDRTHTAYGARSRQLAVEASCRFAFATGEVTPYAEWARNWIGSDAFQEQGGAAVLSGRKANSRADFSTLGLRWGMDMRGGGQQEAWLRLHGSVGRRFAFGDLLPATTLNWHDGDVFTVSGVPVAKQSTVVSLGVAARVSPHGVLDLGYDGQFAGKIRDNGMRARYSLRF
jgi:subtilase-type serine protease